jgi:hypothetical protein
MTYGTSFGVRPAGGSEARRRIDAAGHRFQSTRMDGGDPPEIRHSAPVPVPDVAPRKWHHGRSVPVWAKGIIASVAAEYGIEPSNLFRPGKREPNLAIARGAFYYQAWTEFDMSLSAMARVLGRSSEAASYSIALYCEETGEPFPAHLKNRLEKIRESNRETYRRRVKAA